MISTTFYHNAVKGGYDIMKIYWGATYQSSPVMRAQYLHTIEAAHRCCADKKLNMFNRVSSERLSILCVFGITPKITQITGINFSEGLPAKKYLPKEGPPQPCVIVYYGSATTTANRRYYRTCNWYASLLVDVVYHSVELI